MLEADLHVHSMASYCGLHTYIELLEQARRISLKALAITDHGLAMGKGRLTSVFFERFQSPFPEIRLYKGIELNLTDEKGSIDLLWHLLPFIDILLLGIHPNTPHGRTMDHYTDMLLAALSKNPFIDIISHPNDPMYPVDFRKVAHAAKRSGMAVELNNSKVRYKRTTTEETIELISICKENGCLVAVNSDTHAILELGNDAAIRPLIERVGFPADLIVNRTAESADRFIEGRRALKREALNKHTEEDK